jgi:hypothetical protein
MDAGSPERGVEKPRHAGYTGTMSPHEPPTRPERRAGSPPETAPMPPPRDGAPEPAAQDAEKPEITQDLDYSDEIVGGGG